MLQLKKKKACSSRQRKWIIANIKVKESCLLLSFPFVSLEKMLQFYLSKFGLSFRFTVPFWCSSKGTTSFHLFIWTFSFVQISVTYFVCIKNLWTAPVTSPNLTVIFLLWPYGATLKKLSVHWGSWTQCSQVLWTHRPGLVQLGKQVKRKKKVNCHGNSMQQILHLPS